VTRKNGTNGAAAEEQPNMVTGMRALSDIVSRASLASAAGLTFGGSRDLYSALGYPRQLRPQDYRSRYKRGDVAARVVEAYPKATWRGGAELIEDEDPEVVTTFEEEWEELSKRLRVWPTLQRADVLAGLGPFAVVLIGAAGDVALEMPRLRGPDDVLYLLPYGSDEVTVASFEENVDSPRFGLPLTYNLARVASTRTITRKIHWTRIVHVADNVLDDRVNGAPLLERVWNRLDDLDKVVGGGSEAFWLRVHKGLIFNLDPNIKVEQEQIDKLKEEAEEFAHNMRRSLAARGFEVTDMGSDVARFNDPVDAIIALISGATGIPQRILLGSERGQLASTQDKENWDERIRDRRDDYAEPVVRDLVDRLTLYGALSEPDEYNVRWPEVDDLNDKERAEIAVKWADLNSKAGGPVVLPEEIRDRVLRLDKLTPEQIEEWEGDKPEPPVAPPPPAPGAAGEEPPPEDGEPPNPEEQVKVE
jgi:uncharacterized protein